MTRVREIETGQGVAEVVTHVAEEQEATLVLTHGAGGDVGAPDLAGLAEQLPALGYSVLLVRMPWRVAGRRLAPRPAVIDAAYREVLDAFAPDGTWVLGGRSAGARSACRIGSSAGAAAVLALSFPLHPPGKPEKSRLDELTGAGLPVLVVQGERDPFGRPEEFPDELQHELVAVPAADHSLKVPRRADIGQEEAMLLVVESVVEWLERVVRRES